MRFPGTGTFLLAAAVLATPLAGRAQTSNEVRVLTFNLRYASAADGANSWSNSTQAPERRQVALRVITNRSPDLIGFQEGENVQLDYLAASLPGYGFDRRKPSGGGGNENAALAWNTNRLELLDRGVFSLGTAPGGGYWNNPPGTNFSPYVFFPDMGLGFPRLALWGRFRWKATGQELLFYTTHFDFNDTPQMRSAALIADDARSRNDRMPRSPLTVVVGDFNSCQTNRDWRLFTGTQSTNGITGDFTDSWQQTHASWTNSGTIHGFSGGTIQENQRIDWILHRGGLLATQCVIVTDSYVATNLANGTTRTQYPSDHYPVLAVLRLPDPPADYDRDGLPDARELSSTNALPADPDTDNDLLLDGQEDLDGDGVVDGGETDPSQATATQNPTDIRNYQMNGVRDFTAATLASNGLPLFARFDGRYLYVATDDAGEGSDHFLFVSTNPVPSVSAPWAKAGQVAPWVAFLADENDTNFSGWFDAGGALITNLFAARAATYFENGGRLEGVLDLGAILGAGFTSALYVAAGPWASADGGALFSGAQVPAGNGDGNLTGTNEFVRIDPGDLDGDGLSNAADPDADGDGLSDAWEVAQLNTLAWGGADDPDGDGAENRQEGLACTDPADSNSVFKLLTFTNAGGGLALSWPVVHGKTATIARAEGAAYGDGLVWTGLVSAANATGFPVQIAGYTNGPSGAAAARFWRVGLSP